MENIQELVARVEARYLNTETLTDICTRVPFTIDEILARIEAENA